jgi:hypothetical protein
MSRAVKKYECKTMVNGVSEEGEKNKWRQRVGVGEAGGGEE